MNEDHSNTIQSALHAEHDIKDKEATMIGLSIDGYYIRSKGNVFFINFDYPVFTSKEYRNVLIELSKKYRSFEF
jgi:putative heme iron utilization protein